MEQRVESNVRGTKRRFRENESDVSFSNAREKRRRMGEGLKTGGSPCVTCNASCGVSCHLVHPVLVTEPTGSDISARTDWYWRSCINYQVSLRGA